MPYSFQVRRRSGFAGLEASRFSNDTIAITPENLAPLQRYSKKKAEIEEKEKIKKSRWLLQQSPDF
ncbi:hypothetical protein [Larkinella rosea]|uniref:Uncharacterized protein n=1 Tax=Larkinella rosea TaxID=2025312 RepID=A0A3P1BJF8_9BACT|nr:hypothetical protein [Larkinella rosea]RRB01188.1 hypothetical protein EHT25_23735 [Larkinella rosea]